MYSTVLAGMALFTFTWARPLADQATTTYSTYSFASNGFYPSLRPSGLISIQNQANGTLPQATGVSPPPIPSPDSITSLGLIAFNELMEIAFFTELIENITNNADGYQDVPDSVAVLERLKTIQAQEELHFEVAHSAFETFSGGQTIESCTYAFPVSDFGSAMALASTFTDVALGTLPRVQQILAQGNGAALIPGIGAVIGQEGEQNGWFRGIMGKDPIAVPFLTGGGTNLAFSTIVQHFIVDPDSCASVNLLRDQHGLRIYQALDLKPRQTIDSITDKNIYLQVPSHTPPSDLVLDYNSTHVGYITYMNQQNQPWTYSFDTDTDYDNVTSVLRVWFPGASHSMNGLTIAAVTNKGWYASNEDVDMDTRFGPGLIEVW